ATLAVVAVATGAHQVLPLVAAAAMLWHHVIQREVLGADPAVLAGMTIPQEDLTPRQPNPGPRTFDQVVQANHGGDVPGAGGRMQNGAVDLEDLGLATVNQNQGAPRMANVQWLIVLV